MGLARRSRMLRRIYRGQVCRALGAVEEICPSPTAGGVRCQELRENFLARTNGENVILMEAGNDLCSPHAAAPQLVVVSALGEQNVTIPKAVPIQRTTFNGDA